MDTIRIFVGSSREDQAAGAETVLEHSVRLHTSHPVEFVWMRAGDPGWRVGPKAEVGPEGDLSWNIGREAHRLPWTQPVGGTWTGFSDFRWAIPELTGFKGKAIYVDVDQWFMTDVAELWNAPMPKPWTTTACKHQFRVETSLIDCGYFEDKTWYPRIEALKKGSPRKMVVKTLWKHQSIAKSLDASWNCMDHVGEGCKVLHATQVRTQPWRPQEANVPEGWYQRHPNEDFANCWFDLYTEATGEVHKYDVRVKA